jgi:hypothetical protein
MAQVFYDRGLSDFCTFSIIIQKGNIVGESPVAKHIKKTLIQEYNFLRIFALEIFEL